MRTAHSGWKPTEIQKMLIRSAVLDPVTALSCWKDWRRHAEIESLDHDSYRLLPMVFRNLGVHIASDDPYYGKLKGTYKKSWFSNRMILQSALRLFKDLLQTGISPVLLKGIHLIISYYDDIAVRPIGDADFLVSWEDAERTGEYLESAGWRMIETYRYPVFRKGFMAGRRSVGYVNPDGYRCDLHWNLSVHRCHPDADTGFLTDTEEIGVGGLKLRGLRTEYLLLNVLEHGVCGYPAPAVRWIPDSLKILEQSPGLDWDRFIQGVITSHLEINVRQMLQYLADEFGTVFPVEAVRRLSEAKISRMSIEISRSMNPSRTRAGRDLKEFFRHFLRYRIYMKEYRNRHITKSPGGFIRFLAFRWGRETGFMFPLIFIRKLAGKLVRTIKRFNE